MLLPAERLYAVLGLMLLVIPVLAEGFGARDSRAERIFGAQVGLVMFLLYGFMPRPQLSLGGTVVVTFGWSGALAALYLLIAPATRRVWRNLLVVVGLINVATLIFARLSVTKSIGFFSYLAGLVVIAASVCAMSILVIRLIERARGGREQERGPPASPGEG